MLPHKEMQLALPADFFAPRTIFFFNTHQQKGATPDFLRTQPASASCQCKGLLPIHKTGQIPPPQRTGPGRRPPGAVLPCLTPAEAVTPSFRLQLAFLSLPRASLSPSSDRSCDTGVTGAHCQRMQTGLQPALISFQQAAR